MNNKNGLYLKSALLIRAKTEIIFEQAIGYYHDSGSFEAKDWGFFEVKELWRTVT